MVHSMLTYRRLRCGYIRGFSLVEVMVGFAIFSIIAMGMSLTAILSLKISHLNVMRTTAYASAQAFLEQIKVIEEDDIIAALADPDVVPIPTRTVSSLHGGTDDEGNATIYHDDTLYLDDPYATAKGENHKQIVIDLKGVGSKTREVTMDVWYDLDITEFTFSNGYIIELGFTYEINGLRSVPTQQGRLSIMRTSQTGSSE